MVKRKTLRNKTPRKTARKTPRQRKPEFHRARLREQREANLRVLVREAAKAGTVEAIEHCGNFWQVGDGYKSYIEYQLRLHAQALLGAVKMALREDRDEQARMAREQARMAREQAQPARSAKAKAKPRRKR